MHLASSVTSTLASKLCLTATLVGGLAFAGWSRASGLDELDGLVAFDLASYVLVTLLIVVNVWRRGPAQAEDTRFGTWCICLASYVYYLAFEPGDGFAWVVVLHLLGDSSLVYLGKSFALLPARRSIKVGWLYRWVRHPAYSSYLLADVSYCVAVPSLWNVVVALVGCALLVVRAQLEERVLSSDPEYRRYQLRTPSRFIPWIY
jgi:protein-S-isoprenylcysteine O-methyltransferase Ste14